MNTDSFEIREDDLSGPEVAGLVQEHLDATALLSPRESVHALDLEAMRAPDVTFWSVWQGSELVGCGALRELDASHGEVKSMRTASSHLRKGVAAALLEHMLNVARQRVYLRLSLETGSMEAFAPARALYARFGFELCEPFADYVHDPNSVFMTRLLGMSDLDRLDDVGYAVIDPFLQSHVCDELCRQLENLGPSGRQRRGGVRNLFARSAATRALVRSAPVRELVERVLSPKAFAVRAILFDKTADSNWSVTWHQDLTIAVNHRTTVSGFGPWSVKAGIVHVQPPPGILENMLTIRIHLDPCGPDNGALQVIPESHRLGIAPRPPDSQRPPATCVASRGGAVLMRPLLWHSSRKAACPTRRRVVHVEFAHDSLPPPLDWQERY